ncbi:MAG: magnesium transporter [Desulfovibrio sp.]
MADIKNPLDSLLPWVEGLHRGDTDVEVPHPADAADQIERLDIEDQVKFVKQLPIQDAADSIAEMEQLDQGSLVRQLNVGFAARVLGAMSPDDATDIIDDMEEELQEKILARMKRADRSEIESLLTFDPDTAGGVMNTEIVILDEGLTVDQAITQIREEVEDKEIPYYAYIVDRKGVLGGVLSLRDLLVSRHGKKLIDLYKTQNLITVTFDEDQEEVSRLISHYGFLALPVVDHEDRLLGVVTVDDAMDIMEEEASEDMQSMVGAGMDETTDSPWLYSVRQRLPWLVLNIANSAVSAWVVHLFEGNIAQMAVLAVLMPIVANQAGNTGQQALAVMIRQLATEKFDRKRSWVAVLRELKIGALNAVIIAMVVFGFVMLMTSNATLAMVMSLALGMDMIIGAFAGASIPLILKEIGRDPAQASSIFLTTITDSLGFLALLGLAGLFLL